MYRYQRFTRQVMREAASFGAEGGIPARSALCSTGGELVNLRDLADSAPLVIVCASITCPMAAAAAAPLRDLHGEFGDRVTFVTLYTREAHPGDRFRQPGTRRQKMDHARAYELRDGIPWLVAVDDLDGTVHRAIDAKPNAVYFVSRGGRTVFRVLWANDEAGLRRGFARLLSNTGAHAGSSETKIRPMFRGLAFLDEVLGAAGRGAREDFRRATPVAYAVGWLAWRIAQAAAVAQAAAWRSLTGLMGRTGVPS